MALLIAKKKTEFFDLPDWLEIGTVDLEASAQRRIAAEIQTHYTDSVAAHIANGATESAAKNAALSELGNPQTAAKRFKKTYLTKSDISYMRARVANYANPFFSRKAILIDSTPVIFLVLCYIIDAQFSRSLAWLTFTWFTICYIFFRVFPRVAYRRSNQFSHEIALSYVAGWIVWAVSLTLDGLIRGEFVQAFLLIGSVALGICPYLRIWRKLRNNHSERNDHLAT